MKWILSLFFISFLASCQHQYTVIIDLKDSLSNKEEKFTEHFKKRDDTAAYKEAFKRYWVYKCVIREANRKRSGNNPEPIRFTLINEDNKQVQFSAQQAELITRKEYLYWEYEFRKADTTKSTVSKKGILEKKANEK